MLRILLSFFLLVVVLTGCVSQRPYRRPIYCTPPVPALRVLHLVDRNGMAETISNRDKLEKYLNVDFMQSQPYAKVLRIFGEVGADKVCALITSYYENGQLCQYLEVVNNRAHGYYREWHDNGQMRLEAFVIGGMADISAAAEKSWLFDGCCRAWNAEGDLTGVVHYAKGKLEGESLYYHPNGKLWKRSSFHQNVLTGMYEVFYNDGSVLQRVPYIQGERHGQAYRYWQDGSLAAEEEYEQGLLCSGNYYDHQGKSIASITEGTGFRAAFGAESVCELHEYRQGKPEGEVRHLDSAGRIVKCKHIKDGMKHGPEIDYYPYTRFSTPQPKLQVTWHEGKCQGVMKTWYPDGTPESQREMSNNAKNGFLMAWYRDGSLMLLEEYTNDGLQKGEYYRRGEKVPVSEVLAGHGMATLYDSEGNLVRKVHYRDGKPFE